MGKHRCPVFDREALVLQPKGSWPKGRSRIHRPRAIGIRRRS
jgi:hypothetical protein